MAAIRISVKGPWSFAVGLGVSVIIMEAALHLTEATPAWRVLPVVERQLGWPDPDQGYAFRPNQSIINVRENRAIATTNSFGIRDRETVLEKAAGLTRVALMGDSRTEALQVGDDQSFDTLAEHLLNEAAGRRQYEILNLAMSGAGPLRMYFQLTERGLQFDPDIAIFVMSIGDFLSTALGDDSKNPGYVLDESGKLTIGYGFRQRRSQRLRDEPIGRLFFWLMDHSRVALAIYAKQRKEIGGDVFRPGRVTTVSPRPSPCELVEAKLADNLDLWRDGRPELQARRLERYLEDVGALAAENRLPTVFIFRRLGYPSGQCPEIHARRQALVEQIKERLGRHEIFMADADALIYGRVGSLAETRKQRGFGANLGSGHLNEFGHAVYAELLARIIEETAAP